MPAIWSTPKTWNTGEPLTAADLNAHLRDNLEYLKDKPSNSYLANELSDYSTTSTSFVNIDATRFSFNLTTKGEDVLIGFFGSFNQNNASHAIYLDVLVDSNRLGNDDGLLVFYPNSTAVRGVMSFVYLLRGLAAGAHTIRLQWKVSGGTVTLHAGAGTASYDVHPEFWVKEI
ncbi:MAG: hypothetical protein K8L97_05480 [Anaerolineae bacterium]|nr:hypothetical protein [Anaerolineae bacterium]